MMRRLLVTGFREEAIQPLVRLSPEWAVTALLSAPPGTRYGLIEHSATLREHRVPRSEAWTRDCEFLSDKPGVDAETLAFARTVGADESLRRTFLRYAAEADCIVHTSATLFELDQRCAADGKPRVYHAPAGPEFPRICDTDSAGPFAWLAFPVWALETRLSAACSHIVTDDAEAFRRWYDGASGKVSAVWRDPSSEPAPRAAPRRSVLLVNDGFADDPNAGGYRRIRALNRVLALTDFEVTLLCLSEEHERRDTVIGPHFRQTAVPATHFHRELQARMDRHGDFGSDLVALLHCMDNERLVQEFCQASTLAGLVVFEQVYLAPLARLLPPEVPVVYSAHNVESSLKAQALAGDPNAADLCAAVEAAETFLLERADVVVAVSREDAAEFSQSAPGTPVHVVANGVCASPGRPTGERDGIVFTAGYPPHREALEFILSRLAPAFPQTRFSIVGASEADVPPGSMPPNVVLAGAEQKAELLASAAVAIHPVFSGGGAGSELAEYLAWGLPVVSAPHGARGFDAVSGVHLVLAGEEDFAQTLRGLLDDESVRERLGCSAREYVARELDWAVLGERWRSIVDALAQPAAAEKELLLRPAPLGVSVAAGGLDVVLAARPGIYMSDDGGLRASVVSPELDRYLALHGPSATRAKILVEPRSATRGAAAILRMYGIPTEVTETPNTTWRQALSDEWLRQRQITDWKGLVSNHAHTHRLMLGNQSGLYTDWQQYALQVHLEPLLSVVRKSCGRDRLRMLSLGCGDGRIEASLLSNGWPVGELWCAEYDSQLLAEACKRLSSFDCKVEGRWFDLDLPFDFGRFDVVFFCHSIHHCANVEVLLPCLNNSLEEHGIVVGVDYFGPCRCQLDYEVKPIVDELFSLLPEHLRLNLAEQKLVFDSRMTVASIETTRASDPSEAPASANIRSLLFSTFPIVEIRPMGGTILRPLLAQRAGNFLQEDEPLLGLLQFIERKLIESRQIPSDDLFFVLRRSERL